MAELTVPFFKKFHNISVDHNTPLSYEQISKMSKKEKSEYAQTGDALWLAFAAHELNVPSIASLAMLDSEHGADFKIAQNNFLNHEYDDFDFQGDEVYVGTLFGVKAVLCNDRDLGSYLVIDSKNKTKTVSSDEYLKALLDVENLNKDTVLKAVLKNYKMGHASFSGDLIKILRQYGYDYPEFKAIEKSMGKITEAVEKPVFFAYYPAIGEIGIVVMVHDNIRRGDNMLIAFDKDGKIEMISIRASDEEKWEKYKSDIIETCLYSILTQGPAINTLTTWPTLAKELIGNKPLFMKTLLRLLKNHENSDQVQFVIDCARETGYDYPEFAAIEKSIKNAN